MLKVVIPKGHIPEKYYILSVLFNEFLGIEYRVVESVNETNRSAWVIEMPGQNGRFVLQDVFFLMNREHWLNRTSLPVQPIQKWPVLNYLPETNIVKPSIPVIFGIDPSLSNFFKITQDEIRLGLDVFGSVFFMLTLYEELVKQERDEHDRFPGKESLACQEGLVGRPIVNEYVEILWTCIKRLWPGLERKKREYRLILSHDVDDIFAVVEKPAKQVIRRIGGDLIVRRDPILALKSVRAAWRGNPAKDPCNTFDFIMDQSEKCGVASTFNFMANMGDSEYDGRYQIDHPWVRNCLRRIVERGHLIGFHSTYGSYLNAERVKSEFLQLKKAAEEESAHQDEWGGRQHYLRWNNPSTWQHWEDAGLTYDSTVGFADRIGFRTGCCYEYPVFNLKTRKTLSLRERPLVVMEGTVTNRDGTLGKEPQKRICLLSQLCKKFSGDFTLLWHNGNVISQKQRETYVSTVSLL